MKKVVLSLEFADEKIQKKAMKKVSGLSGVESIAMDLKDKKLIVTGDIDPVSVVDKLRKLCQTKIVSIGPAKEPEKPKEQPKPQVQPEDMSEYLKARQEYYKQQQQLYDYYSATSKQPAMPGYYVESVEENPNACVIC
ncbi:heavy metal-associated isoprenylated plant protein 39-like [Olea europaea var. sylvestris]|uniref:Heavy metal-associated isoprenylated plant 3-like isoform X1 n=1 Tax=Olea europaea subsp. europaea TaxID=158383 RepID=A0A8S0QEI4_OLEEU|nr:heavy metal-associated isoprenylated plant protein 39-like [Olea europaea var. sylvestris]CAA2964039.1 heavy metal-associated isoprenylated plant 3-like isoform X1 [Olea europaea subsp. europaea]